MATRVHGAKIKTWEEIRKDRNNITSSNNNKLETTSQIENLSSFRVIEEESEEDKSLQDRDHGSILYKSASSGCIEPSELINEASVNERTICRPTSTEFAFCQTQSQQEIVLKIIEATKSSESTSIDLSGKELIALPFSLLEMSDLEYIYLEGNKLVSLPEDFFKYFPYLRWLDLRNNLLSQIPSAFISSHACLRNLLLEGNNIRSLPKELGLAKSLHGLNISGNPLDFPPQEIIEKGTPYILHFLKEMLEVENQAIMADLELKLSEDLPCGFENVSASSDDWNTIASLMDIARRRERMMNHESLELADHDRSGAKPAMINKPVSFVDEREPSFCQQRKPGFGGILKSKKIKKSNNLTWKVNHYPSPPPQEYVASKINEEKQLAKIKEFREKTDTILQKWKDIAVLKNWQTDAKTLQMMKYAQDLVPGKDYQAPAEQAPYHVEEHMMKVLSKEDRIKADMLRKKELEQMRTISPATCQKRERENLTKIHELEKKIKDHMALMMERRTQVKGTPQHELAIAWRELETAEQLFNEIQARRKEVEFGFKISPGELLSSAGLKKHHIC